MNAVPSALQGSPTRKRGIRVLDHYASAAPPPSLTRRATIPSRSTLHFLLLNSLVLRPRFAVILQRFLDFCAALRNHPPSSILHPPTCRLGLRHARRGPDLNYEKLSDSPGPGAKAFNKLV